MSERIQKVLARAGVGSRREVEDWIRAGRLAINGVPAALGAQLRPRDRVTLDGRPVRLRAPESATRVIVYHRTPGQALSDEEAGAAGRLFDKLPKRAGRRWVPVSPLPPNDGGLELLTSDGDLAQALMRKLGQLRIEFAVRLRGELTDDQLEGLRHGGTAEGERVEVETLQAAGGEGANRWYTLVTRGGRARDLHRLFKDAGVELSRLMRVSLGPVTMERSLARERSRPLDPAETAELYTLAGLELPELLARIRRTPAKTAPVRRAGQRDGRRADRIRTRGRGLSKRR
ncbi:MAG TPA: S4 domain-containing protein [Steroidobacteraceae bacterium]|nr:S4 domain-containing protein [Steroidobacteraceae bacterium]